MFKMWLVVIVNVACLTLLGSENGDPISHKLPRMPQAQLLVGYPPFSLYLTTPTETFLLQKTGIDMRIVPSMSRDGAVIGGVQVQESGAGAKMAVATYSFRDKTWTHHTGFLMLRGPVTISPDGSHVAYAIREQGHGTPSRIHIIDLKSRVENISPIVGQFDVITMSWSPDGKSIVFDIELNRPLSNGVPWLRPAIYILDTVSWNISKLADGENPSWSPSGQWIAYNDYSPDREDSRGASEGPAANRMWMIHPDGTGAKLVRTLSGRSDLFARPPVWSPDSSKVLLSRLRDVEKSTVNIYLLDLDTMKETKLFADVPPVYGWVKAE